MILEPFLDLFADRSIVKAKITGLILGVGYVEVVNGA
jgi:hypothetical protein